MSTIKAGLKLALSVLIAACATQQAAGRDAADAIHETNVTNDLNLSSGEPQIALNPRNPGHIAIIEFAVGSARVPAFKSNPLMAGPDLRQAANEHNGRVMLSKDGGNTWTMRAPVLNDDRFGNGADPAIAFGPDGTMYINTVLAAKVMPADFRDVSGFRNIIAMSRDGGKTFSKPEIVESAPHRPWLKVDNKTGKVYLQVIGFDPSVKDQSDPSKQDGWVVTWQPHLAAHSEPRHMGGPGFSAMGHIAVANGVVASVFAIGGGMFGGGQAPATPVPAALQGLVKNGATTCSGQAPCVFFQTSTDDGKTWARHQVPVPPGRIAGFLWLAADPGKADRYAIGYTGANENSLHAMVTDDSGNSWSGPFTVPAAGKGRTFKAWMDYGPTGVLGIMWKQVPDELPNAAPAAPKAQTPDEIRIASMERRSPAFNVYAAISCDGGKTWQPPVRVNAETSPAGVGGLDDMSDIKLDAKYVHLVWGDTRAQSRVTNAPGAIGGVQAYYGRVPFSVAAKGAQCGRK